MSFVELKVTIRGGLPVYASGIYRKADPGNLYGDWPYPPEPACIEDLEIRFIRGMHLYPMKKLSQKELDRVEQELINFCEKGEWYNV